MQLTVSPDDLRPIVQSVVADVLNCFGGNPDRLAWPEAEAAGLLGVKSHVLRDARLRGEIIGAKLGRGYSYTRADLLAWLDKRRRSVNM